jgi:hypothetical protein
MEIGPGATTDKHHVKSAAESADLSVFGWALDSFSKYQSGAVSDALLPTWNLTVTSPLPIPIPGYRSAKMIRP